MPPSNKDDGARPPGAGELASSPRVQARYRAVREAMLEVLPVEGEGLTLKDIGAAIAPLLPRPLFPNGPGFYTLAVKTHLESIGLLRTLEGTRPPRHLRTDDIHFA